MTDKPYGRVLGGDDEAVARSYDAFRDQPVDHDIGAILDPYGTASAPYSDKLTTLGKAVSVTGPGTFFGKAQRTLEFAPSVKKGWWLNRTDLPDQMPIYVSVSNIWTVVRNIVLSSGSPHNYVRMVEHIIALKVGMGLDNVMIHMDSGDPPLFDRSSMDLVEAIEEAGVVSTKDDAKYVTVKEPVTIGGGRGDFLTLLPPEPGKRHLDVDCAVNFRSAIGKQRIRFRVNNQTFRYGASARTNTTLGMMIYCKTIGKIFADVRNLGYTTKNILVAGPRRYFNEPYLLHEGKSLEAVWHRAALDLLAAIALIDKGRFAGTILSYKSGHFLDVQMVRELYKQDLLVRIE